MSDLYVRLVAGLTPPCGRRYHVTTPTAPRDRFVLYTLAYLADEQGRCQISMTDLSAITLHPSELIRTSIRTWEAQGVVIRSQEGGRSPNTYQLDRAALDREQFNEKLYDGFSIWEVENRGGSTRAVNALLRHNIRSMEELGSEVRAYRALPDEGRKGFHRYLQVPSLGAELGRQIMDAYDTWRLDQVTS